MVDAAMYKQQRPMGNVDFPWAFTKDKTITLFPLQVYKLEATRQGRESARGIVKGRKATLKNLRMSA